MEAMTFLPVRKLQIFSTYYINLWSGMKGFTLIELIIVIIHLGILSTVAVPRFLDIQLDTQKGVLIKALSSMRSGPRLQGYESRIEGQTGFPRDLRATLERREIPQHPQNTFGVATLETVFDPLLVDPDSKVLKAGVSGSYWYNWANGIVKARVIDVGTEAATIDFYNEVNGTDINDLGNYGANNNNNSS